MRFQEVYASSEYLYANSESLWGIRKGKKEMVGGKHAKDDRVVNAPPLSGADRECGGL